MLFGWISTDDAGGVKSVGVLGDFTAGRWTWFPNHASELHGCQCHFVFRLAAGRAEVYPGFSVTRNRIEHSKALTTARTRSKGEILKRTAGSFESG